MVRTHDGHRVYNFAVNTKESNRRPVTDWQTPENIKPRQIPLRLCELGPKECAECRLCAFGRWYVDHDMGSKKGKQKAAVAV